MAMRIMTCADGSKWEIQTWYSGAGTRSEARAIGTGQATVGRTEHGWYFGGKCNPLELPAQVVDAVGADYLSAVRKDAERFAP